MSKKRKVQKDNVQSPDNISNQADRMVWYSSLHFIPIEKKNKRWAAEVLYFNKNNSRPFASAKDVQQKRDIQKGIIQTVKYKGMIDPDGDAELFSSDWKGNPIDQHLDNIIDARVEKIPNNLVVKAVDEFSKSNQVKENERILGQGAFRNLINQINHELGWPPLKPNEDPFTYVKRMEAGLDSDGKKYSKDIPMGIVDSIRSQIQDDEDLALFNEYLWKDGVEIACELGIDYYLFNLNRFTEIAEKVLMDIRHFNQYAMRFYTSQTTGAPVLEYMSPEQIKTSEFENPDGSDIIHWHKEYFITFGNFIRQMGANLSPEQLRDIFEKNKKHNVGINDYSTCSFMQRNSARILIGYMEFESQDMEVYTEYVYNGNERFRKANWNYFPSEKGIKEFQAKRIEKNYNVWRSFYYIPEIESTLGSTNFDEQAKYIFELKKIQDQQREGDDWRYAKSSLIMYFSPKMSYFDIKEAFMPYINLLWLQSKNEFVQAHPHGLMWFEEFFAKSLAIADETVKNPTAKKSTMISKIRQTGSAMGKVMQADGKIINEGKPFVDIKTGHIASAIDRINAMMILYQMMTRALGISETSEGVDPKPRQSFGAIKSAMEGTSNATYSIEKYYSKAVTQCGERLLYYIKSIVDEKDSSRLKEFQNVVGKANGMAVESIKDIPMHTLGLSVQNIITEEQKAFVNGLAQQMAGAGTLDEDTALFLTMVDNLKYSYAILRLKMKQKKREVQQATEADRNFKIQMKQEDQKFQILQIQTAEQGNYATKEMMKKWDAQIMQMENMIKQQGQLEVKDKIKDNRVEEKVVEKQLADGETV